MSRETIESIEKKKKRKSNGAIQIGTEGQKSIWVFAACFGLVFLLSKMQTT